jgi:hypothetical protein
MAWYHFFVPRPSTAQLVKLAHTLARSNHHQVLAETRGRAVAMSRAESRGYVRAKAAAHLRHEVERLIAANRDLGNWAYDTLVNHSVDAVVQLVSTDLHRLRTAAPLRRAA